MYFDKEVMASMLANERHTGGHKLKTSLLAGARNQNREMIALKSVHQHQIPRGISARMSVEAEIQRPESKFASA